MSQVCQRCEREKPDDSFSELCDNDERAKVCLDCAQIVADDFNRRVALSGET